MREIGLFRIGWPLAENELVVHEGSQFVVNGKGSSLDKLPVEFFSHQLMELDVSNTDKLLSFVSAYGIPRHPSRYGIGGMPLNGERFDDVQSAKEKTDLVQYVIHDVNDQPYWFSTSLEEVRLSLEDLQTDIQDMFNWMQRNDESYWSGRFINTGTAYPYTVHTGKRTFPDFSLTNAICNQVVETISDDALWKTCECEGCERPFKHHQPKKGTSAKTGKNPSRSKYCCIKCQNRQGARNKREAAKNRIKH